MKMFLTLMVLVITSTAFATPCVISKRTSAADVVDIDSQKPFDVEPYSVKQLKLEDGYRGQIAHSSNGRIALTLANGSMRTKTIGSADAGVSLSLETDDQISTGYSIHCGSKL